MIVKVGRTNKIDWGWYKINGNLIYNFNIKDAKQKDSVRLRHESLKKNTQAISLLRWLSSRFNRPIFKGSSTQWPLSWEN